MIIVVIATALSLADARDRIQSYFYGWGFYDMVSHCRSPHLFLYGHVGKFSNLKSYFMSMHVLSLNHGPIFMTSAKSNQKLHFTQSIG